MCLCAGGGVWPQSHFNTANTWDSFPSVNTDQIHLLACFFCWFFFSQKILLSKFIHHRAAVGRCTGRQEGWGQMRQWCSGLLAGDIIFGWCQSVCWINIKKKLPDSLRTNLELQKKGRYNCPEYRILCFPSFLFYFYRQKQFFTLQSCFYIYM